MSKPALVLDTNIVLDLLHFDDPAARPLGRALRDGRARCLVSVATLEEWRRVLAYPEFGLDPARQVALFEAYQALSDRVDGAAVQGGLPRCADPDDQKFLDLAGASLAQGLVSKDRALLKLRRRCASRFRIMTLAEAATWLGA